MRKSALIAALTAAVLVVPLGVYASHQFTDVPDSHLFHNAIGWLADNDVTKGCNPPTNTAFCPDDNVTRGQMAAFMKRLSEGQIVDAGALGGEGPDAYKSRAGGTDFFIEDWIGGVVHVAASITGFTVPASGGAIVASADLSHIGVSGPQLGLAWIEVDGSGACDAGLLGNDVSVFSTIDQYENGSVSTTAAVSSGDHRADLCMAGLALETTDSAGSLTVQWAGTAEGGTISAASGGRTWAEILESVEIPWDN